jgi:hypothetical protein
VAWCLPTRWPCLWAGLQFRACYYSHASESCRRPPAAARPWAALPAAAAHHYLHDYLYRNGHLHRCSSAPASEGSASPPSGAPVVVPSVATPMLWRQPHLLTPWCPMRLTVVMAGCCCCCCCGMSAAAGLCGYKVLAVPLWAAGGCCRSARGHRSAERKGGQHAAVAAGKLQPGAQTRRLSVLRPRASWGPWRLKLCMPAPCPIRVGLPRLRCPGHTLTEWPTGQGRAGQASKQPTW